MPHQSTYQFDYDLHSPQYILVVFQSDPACDNDKILEVYYIAHELGKECSQEFA
ncbi:MULTISPECIES: hypothetical protein [Paenibacillus]|uniref:hypothetical protein n=1 Tax=Paenibacillus TaxID=44249 RepID=UPI0015C2F83E|nr:hypothetical protein [Paenibacillus odorifer]